MVVLKTNYGVIKIALHHETAPKTVENFLSYVKDGFYDNTIFHRVIDGFMIQGGGFAADMVQKTTKNPIENEAKAAKSNTRGTVAMARTPNPHSASSQFFINVVDNKFLNYTNDSPQGFGYCVFGEVTEEGMDVVDKIKLVPTTSKSGHADVPVEDVMIETAYIED